MPAYAFYQPGITDNAVSFVLDKFNLLLNINADLLLETIFCSAAKKANLPETTTTPETKVKRHWELWSCEDKDSFFEGLCEVSVYESNLAAS